MSDQRRPTGDWFPEPSWAKRIEQKLDTILTIVQKEQRDMAQIDDDLAALAAEVTNLTTVDASAVALINGIAAQVTAAVQAALAAGATSDQLKAITDAVASMQSNDAALAAAVKANTPAA